MYCLLIYFLSCQTNGEDNKCEEILYPSIENPSHHGSEVQPQIVTTDAIDKLALIINESHEENRLFSSNNPGYSTSGTKL